jgi:hypothetical protein
MSGSPTVSEAVPDAQRNERDCHQAQHRCKPSDARHNANGPPSARTRKHGINGADRLSEAFENGEQEHQLPPQETRLGKRHRIRIGRTRQKGTAPGNPQQSAIDGGAAAIE